VGFEHNQRETVNITPHTQTNELFFLGSIRSSSPLEESGNTSIFASDHRRIPSSPPLKQNFSFSSPSLTPSPRLSSVGSVLSDREREMASVSGDNRREWGSIKREWGKQTKFDILFDVFSLYVCFLFLPPLPA